MQSLYLCKNCASQYESANYPVSCSAENGGIWKFEEIRGFISPRYRVWTKATIISKGSYVNEEPKKKIFDRCKKRTSQYGATNYPVSCRAEYGGIWKFE